MLVRITSMVLRVCGVIVLILGILFWTNNATSLIPVHMLLGILITIALWILGVVMLVTKGGNIGIGIGAIVLGILVVGLGLTQQQILVGSAHWIIQVIHLLLGLSAIGMGEMISARYRRLHRRIAA